MVKESKTRETKMTKQVLEKKTAISSENIEEWLAARERVAVRYQYSQEKQGGAFSMNRLDRKCEYYLAINRITFLLQTV